MKEIHKAKFEPTSAILTAYDNGFLEITYGRSTLSDPENEEETRWTKAEFKKIKTAHPKLKYRVLFDFTNIQNVESTTDFSMLEYAKMLKDPEIDKVATFGQTHSFGLIVDIIGKLSKHARKLKVFESREQALDWLEIKE